jgi:peroxiredoxin
VELQERLGELQAQGLGVAAISYDSQDVLADFSRRRGVTFPLLADDDSAVITDFGILNTVAIEAQGPNGDHPDVVADVAKYVSVFGAGSNIVGTPFPGTFMLDGEGRVTARFFEEFYRERNTTANVMLRLGEGLSPIEAIEGETAHLKFTAYASDPAITVGTRFSVAVEIEPNPGMHLYAPGADELGYRVLGLSLSPLPHTRFEPVAYPASEIYHFEPLDERVPVYQAPFTLLQEAVVSGEPGVEDALADIDAVTLSGTLDYQACDDKVCFNPESVPLTWTLAVQALDRTRALQQD